MNKIKLNLGSGDLPLNGFVNLDRKNGQEVYPLGADDNSADEIRASHILEHFGHADVLAVIKNWVSKLKEGGVLKIAVPDFGVIAQRHLNGEDINFGGYIMGGQIDAGDFHRSIFTKKTLTKILEGAGLTDIAVWQSEIRDCASLPISLNLQGTQKMAIDIDALKKANTEIANKKHNKYSQGGEDGIIEEIFSRIGTANKWCFEAGAADGIFFSNTRNLIDQGWRACLVESDGIYREKLRKLENEKIQVFCPVTLELQGLQGENSIDNVLKSCGAPIDIDLISIDIDGQDYHIFNSMLNYNPRVVVIEFAMPSDAERYFGDDFIPEIGGEGQAGSGALIKLIVGKGYIPVVQTSTNIICVRNNLAHLLYGGDQPAESDKSIKIQAVMSIPRLQFTDNMFCAVRAMVVGLGINLEKGSGVFWGQVLTRMMMSHLNDGTDYIITVDYDTWFTKEHVQRLCQLMQETPDVDAIVPIQVKRENDLVMFSKADENGKPVSRVPIEEFHKELTPIVNGHFGLTIFRVSALKKLKKPWFLPLPDPNGGWDENHLDEDIYFWRNFYNSGCKACLAPKINIGHLQLMCTFPGKVEDNWKPIYAYLTDVEKGKVPEHCIPKIEVLK